MVRPDRLILAGKAALGCGLAWWLGHLLPGHVDDYSYYAPLGALIALSPTLMGSVRSTLQTILAIVLGIGLAWAVILSPLPGLVSVALAVSLGVIVGSATVLGAGREYVPIAALFVLVVGGASAEDYSVGYLVQMGLGMAVGLAVNLLIVPPLFLRESAASIEALRANIAETFEAIAASMVEDWPPADTGWHEGVTSLSASIEAAEPRILDAYESRRLNPRARWVRYDVQEDFNDLETLRVVSTHARNLGAAISSAIWADPVPMSLHEGLRRPMSDAIAGTAALVHAWNGRAEHDNPGERAEQSVRALAQAFDELAGSLPADDVTGAVLFDLRRINAIIGERLPVAEP